MELELVASGGSVEVVAEDVDPELVDADAVDVISALDVVVLDPIVELEDVVVDVVMDEVVDEVAVTFNFDFTQSPAELE